VIGFALDAGSSAAGRVFSPLVFELNRLLEQGCSREYFTPSIDIVLSLRVSGEIADFGFDGCDRLRKNQKKKLLTMDIGVPSARWRNASECQLRSLLVEYLTEAIELCAGKLESENQDVKSLELRHDLDRVRNEFQN